MVECTPAIRSRGERACARASAEQNDFRRRREYGRGVRERKPQHYIKFGFDAGKAGVESGKAGVESGKAGVERVAGRVALIRQVVFGFEGIHRNFFVRPSAGENKFRRRRDHGRDQGRGVRDHKPLDDSELSPKFGKADRQCLKVLTERPELSFAGSIFRDFLARRGLRGRAALRLGDARMRLRLRGSNAGLGQFVFGFESIHCIGIGGERRHFEGIISPNPIQTR